MEKGKLLVVGSLNLDLVVDVDHTPKVGETIICGDLVKVPGGKGANQACAAGKLGADVTIIGSVGDDSAAEIEFHSLKNSNVDVSGIIRKENENTGTAFITVNRDGDNCIVVISGANAKLMPEDIDAKLDFLKACDIVIMQLEVPLETVIYVAKKAKELGKKVILDPAPVPKEFPGELYQYLDIIKPNSTEASMLTGIEDHEENWEAMSDKLRSFGVKDALITLGGDGILINSEESGKTRIPAYQVKAVDTTAAGDTFTAALAMELAQGSSLVKAAEFANAASAIVVTRKGAQSSIPSREEVEEFIQNHK